MLRIRLDINQENIWDIGVQNVGPGPGVTCRYAVSRMPERGMSEVPQPLGVLHLARNGGVIVLARKVLEMLEKEKPDA